MFPICGLKTKRVRGSRLKLLLSNIEFLPRLAATNINIKDVDYSVSELLLVVLGLRNLTFSSRRSIKGKGRPWKPYLLILIPEALAEKIKGKGHLI